MIHIQRQLEIRLLILSKNSFNSDLTIMYLYFFVTGESRIPVDGDIHDVPTRKYDGSHEE